MLKIKKFSSSEDMHVVKSFESYLVGDIIPAGKLEKTKAVKLWLGGYLQNVGVKTYKEEQLQAKTFNELKKIGEPYGITDRSKANLIKELLKVL